MLKTVDDYISETVAMSLYDIKTPVVSIDQVSGIRYSYLPEESLANGYYKWHPEKIGKMYMYTKQTQKTKNT